MISFLCFLNESDICSKLDGFIFVSVDGKRIIAKVKVNIYSPDIDNTSVRTLYTSYVLVLDLTLLQSILTDENAALSQLMPFT
jgi:hypothetical protein